MAETEDLNTQLTTSKHVTHVEQYLSGEAHICPLKGEDFGPERPPLFEIIRRILKTYPDGQIFKELIQNADDAGAKKVQFFIDSRQHGTSSLVHPGLAAFQGPALISTNDAVFTNRDWEGLKRLHRSIKADDPFKVGRFGIGFNSVYHLTDVPSIISGDKIAFLDPQERIWSGKPGQFYSLRDVSAHGMYTDSLAPFNDIADFNSRDTLYIKKTLFRFPLRTVESDSDLSENTYKIDKIQLLIDTLRDERDLLLLFLRSVHTIEVYNISQCGKKTLSFKVEVASCSKERIAQKRIEFSKNLEAAHVLHPYCFQDVIEFADDFEVCVEDMSGKCGDNSSGNNHWLVVNQVGSNDKLVQAAAAQQKILPCVGTALKLNGKPENGRIFCFLPMPIETAANLPVHVNGTFSISDNRRNLKWPAIDRRNDPAADWNMILVRNLLPLCYSKLLIESRRFLKPDQFYRALPSVSLVKQSHQAWSNLLNPLFTLLLKEDIIWGDNINQWIMVSSATFTPRHEELGAVVKKVLDNCGLKLATIPPKMWEALDYASLSIQSVTPKLTRNYLRTSPYSFSNLIAKEKYELLSFCLQDEDFSDMHNIKLLPLADDSFTCFETNYSMSKLYITTDECPLYLLPNLKHCLVSLRGEDLTLHSNLLKVADSNHTQLTRLTVEFVASLLALALPSINKHYISFPFPDRQFPSSWFRSFWHWVQDKELAKFLGMFVIPARINEPGYQDLDRFHVIRLQAANAQQAVYVPKHYNCNVDLFRALNKLGIKCCLQKSFPYLKHPHLSKYLKIIDKDGLLPVIALASVSNYSSITFNQNEAHALRQVLVLSEIMGSYIRVLKNLKIFKVCSNSSVQPCSVSEVESHSILKDVIIEPDNPTISISTLPTNVVMFSRSDHIQNILLKKLNISSRSDSSFILNSIFPAIQNHFIHSGYIDTIMTQVLNVFQALLHRNREFKSAIENLSFVKTSSVWRMCPKDLYDPEDNIIDQILQGQHVFPIAPFNSPEYLQILRTCGMRTSITPQKLLDIISEISIEPSGRYPRAVNNVSYTRAKAILKYMSTAEFLVQISGKFVDPNTRVRSTFQDVLKCISSRRSWLPVLANRPESYPVNLPWKGEGFDSNFISLNDSMIVSSVTNIETTAYIVGSQMYLTYPPLQDKVASVFLNSVSSDHVLLHLKEVITNKDELPLSSIPHLVNLIYKELHRLHLEGHKLTKIQEIPKWIYILTCNKFVSADRVALIQNQDFQINLEPYIYLLPVSFSDYSNFFVNHGVEDVVSQAQIVSILQIIKDSIASNQAEVSSSDAWSTVIRILGYLTENGRADVDLHYDLYVPIESPSKWPQLKNAKEVVYIDNNFLKQYSQLDSGETLTFVHHDIHPNVAQHLRLIPLSTVLEITENPFEDAGQHEPLINRLKVILRDYKDGLTIIKELLQNADDAKATEFNICYDARQHHTDKQTLFFPGMLKTHGPALIIHNNKTFSEDDFRNITKLAGATKQNEQLMIGKFGIGFCSVYHITDVPSFISKDRFYIFDPTLEHLSKEIQNRNLPGKRVKITSRYITSSNQLIPYNGLFGFKKGEIYEGTLFRLPLRKSISEVSTTCYSETKVEQLIIELQESSSKLLLYMQNVRKITFQRIGEGECTPSVLFSATKDIVPLPISISYPGNMNKITISTQSKESKVEYWLIASSTGTIDDKYATASVACYLIRTGMSCYSAAEISPKGEMFCFLPLSQTTGLPVHVSSNFAVINNRRGIWTSDKSVTEPEVCWNISLMKTVIPKAYLTLLNILQAMHAEHILHYHDYKFYQFWPAQVELMQTNPWTEFISSFYTLISSSTSKLFYSTYTKEWMHLTQCNFLQHGILDQSKVADSKSLECVCDVAAHLDLPIVELPSLYRKHMKINSLIITEGNFLDLFFENLSSMSVIQLSRNEVIRCMLDVYATENDDDTERSIKLCSYFKMYACIPCSPDGRDLKKVSQLIDQKAPFAGLYVPEEKQFPIETLASRQITCTAMRKLGIIKENIPWAMLINRAQTVLALFKKNQQKALKRVVFILEAIKRNIESGVKPPNSETMTTIDTVEFLPVLRKPKDYPLSWHADSYPTQILSGNQLMITGHNLDNTLIAGSQVAFVDCRFITENVRQVLKIRSIPSCVEVIAQLKELTELFSANCPEVIRSVGRICHKIYGFLDDEIKSAKDMNKEINQVINKMKEFPCVWNGECFIKYSTIAKKWEKNGPYLYPVPSCLSIQEQLVAFLQIKAEFQEDDIRAALQCMKNDFGDQPVDKSCQDVLGLLIPKLKNLNTEDPRNKEFKILLPDETFVLHWSNELTYDDAPWDPMSQKFTYVNESIPRELTIRMNVTPRRNKILDEYTHSKFYSTEFGQSEKLTNRIQHILKDYACDTTVLKELLQNADDAEATRMYVILDKRSHPTKTLPSDDWEDLQGPALLVWNDSIFSEKDIKGIQELGIGGKRSEAESIGQYGIGFNAVYHLTDCPSFISGGETLCVFDPHCHFVPDASPQHPGRRFDELSKGFWNHFPDMRAPYLQSNLENCPPELLNGSLFRLPLRHKFSIVRKSKIVEHLSNHVKSAGDMHTHLKLWAPQIKQAMFFLNHVTDIRFYIIENKSKMMTQIHCYQSHVDKTAQTKRDLLDQKFSDFNQDTANNTYVIHYPLTLSETHDSKEDREEWLIQQGIGDIDNLTQDWKFIGHIKPRHGIAAPMSQPNVITEHAKLKKVGSVSAFTKPEPLKGQLFCFLPLPEMSHLPIHINGNFMITSNRRNLWLATNPGKEDDKSRWNRNLLQAISSSYAHLLEHAEVIDLYVPRMVYTTWKVAKHHVNNYYNIFPDLNASQISGKWLAFAQNTYKKLHQKNPNILALIRSDDKRGLPIRVKDKSQSLTVKWRPLFSEFPIQQVYFWKTRMLHKDEDLIKVKPILERLGMNITYAPNKILTGINTLIEVAEKELKETNPRSEKPPHRIKHVRKCEHEGDHTTKTQSPIDSQDTKYADTKSDRTSMTDRDRYKLPEITPASVFSYYTQFHDQASSRGFPCAIKDSIFKSIEDFITFTNYVLKQVTAIQGSISLKYSEFLDSPFGHPLLLTADGQLRLFDEQHKVLHSTYFALFSESKDKFLHPDVMSGLKSSPYSSEYFVSVSRDIPDNSPILILVQDILAKKLPHSLQTVRTSLADQNLSKYELKSLWKCLCNDEVFSSCLTILTKKWALLVATNGQLFSSNSDLLPVFHHASYIDRDNPTIELKDSESLVSEPQFRLFKKLGMPFVDTELIKCEPERCESCPKLSDYSMILDNLYYLYKAEAFILGIESIKMLIEYLEEIDFKNDKKRREYVLSLPLFENIDGSFTPLEGKTVYIWPQNKVCNCAYQKWLAHYKHKLVFLKPGADWKELAAAEHLDIQHITPEQVYVDFIFPYFSEMNEEERCQHLCHIRDVLYYTIKGNLHLNDSENRFLDNLKTLCCLSADGDPDKVLIPISEFCDHTQEIFRMFRCNFLPECFQKEEEKSPWMNFFEEIGLKTMITEEEFLMLCWATIVEGNMVV